jgi:hypothetical protein
VDLFTLLFTPAEKFGLLTHVIQTLKALKTTAEGFECNHIHKAFSQSYLQ